MWKQKLHVDQREKSPKELLLCRKTIQSIKKTLELLERKHNKSTAAFMEELRTGTVLDQPDLRDDYEAWQSSYESLKKWEELEKQYEEASER